jgi:hypothetical protein
MILNLVFTYTFEAEESINNIFGRGNVERKIHVFNLFRIIIEIILEMLFKIK